ncbi:MAG: thiamine pyrophosphate-dependent enzyme [Hyphomicrobiaceae bacterium]|nr:thiamine pyrophosphate-dependent enzyme [Hyphomicrobiaceae bacterium]
MIVLLANSSISRPAEGAAVSRQEAVDAYRRMLLIRRFEERAGQLYAMGQINGFCHLSIGREAVIAGLAMAATESDQVITSHRCHGHALAQGCDPKLVMAELLGRAGGLNGGKGGSLHLMAPELNFYGGHGIVGAPVSLAAGLAFANRYRANGAVTVCTVGQGAADQGQFYEALNLAQRWQLPVVYVIDNDTGETGHAETTLANRGTALGITGWQVDGVDIGAVRGGGRMAMAMARGGGGPVVLEMLTYPYRGHATPDAGNTGGRQRSLDEIDPVANLKQRLISEGWTSDDDIKTIDREVRAIVREAVAYAQSAAAPVAADLKRDVVAAAS